MDCSFTPNGDWFVFDTDTGRTLRRKLISKQAAVQWIIQQRLRATAS